MRLTRIGSVFIVALLARLACGADQPAETDRLSEVLVAGEDWQVVAEHISFADGASADVDGNMYFSDMHGKPPVIWKIAPDGTQSKLAEASMSGTRTGPDGKLYAVGNGKLVSIDPAGGQVTPIADGLKTNDLILTHKGFLYLSETAKNQITLVDTKSGETKAVATGIKGPNGIGVSPDQTSLFVSEAGGVNVWRMAIADDGTLSEKKSFATMKTPPDKPTVAHGDGMIGDTAGRWYVTTALGIQVFDADGQLMGVIPRPQPGLNNIALAGPKLQYLYITCGTKIYRRRTQSTASLGYRPPLGAPPAAPSPAATQPAVQVNLSKLLNARPVITARDGMLQLSDHALDHGNSILITASAAKVSDAGNVNPLSDSGFFAANEAHPDVQLPYGVTDAGPQVWRSDAATETAAIPVPAGHYNKMQLFFISANGATPISVALHYSDGSAETRTTIVPDFYWLLKPTDKGWFSLAEDFGKVDAKGKMTEVRHHFIDGFNVDPDPAKELTQIELTKEQSKTVLNLFGAAGQIHRDKP